MTQISPQKYPHILHTPKNKNISPPIYHHIIPPDFLPILLFVIYLPTYLFVYTHYSIPIGIPAQGRYIYFVTKIIPKPIHITPKIPNIYSGNYYRAMAPHPPAASIPPIEHVIFPVFFYITSPLSGSLYPRDIIIFLPQK